MTMDIPRRASAQLSTLPKNLPTDLSTQAPAEPSCSFASKAGLDRPTSAPVTESSGGGTYAPKAGLDRPASAPGTESSGGHPDKNPELEAAAEVELCQARHEVIRDMRARPDACDRLGLTSDFMDDDLLPFLARVDNLRFALRSAGFSPKDSVRIETLLPKALAAPRPKAEKSLCTCRCAFITVSLLGILPLVVLIFWQVAQASAGWEKGICNISGFGHNDSCVHERCTLELKLRKVDRARYYYMPNWELPLEPRSYREERVRLRSEPFRCCDLSRTFSCCQMLNVQRYAFCDNWPWLDDADGNRCPDGNWDCLFQAEFKPNSEDIQKVTDVKVYEPPTLWPFFLGIAILSFLALFALLIQWIPSSLNIGYLLHKVVSKSRSSREENERLADAASHDVVERKDDASEEEASDEQDEDIKAHAAEDPNVTRDTRPSIHDSVALKKRSLRLFRNSLRQKGTDALKETSLENVHSDRGADEPQNVQRSERSEDGNEDSPAPLPPEVSRVPSAASGSSQAGSNSQHERKSSRSSLQIDASKGLLKRGFSNQMYLPPPPKPVPDEVPVAEGIPVELHPAFQTGDLSKIAQQPLGELLQPIIAPLPHSMFRSSRDRSLKIAGSPPSGSQQTREIRSFSSQPASRAGRQPSAHVEPGVRQSLRVAARGSEFPGFPDKDTGRRALNLNSQVSPSRKIPSTAHGVRKSPGLSVIDERAVKNAAVRGVLLPGDGRLRTHLEPQRS